MLRISCLLIVACLTITHASADTSQNASAAEIQKSSQFLSYHDQSNIYFSRPSSNWNTHTRFEVTIESLSAGSVSGGQFFNIQAAPGKYNFTVRQKAPEYPDNPRFNNQFAQFKLGLAAGSVAMIHCGDLVNFPWADGDRQLLTSNKCSDSDLKTVDGITACTTTWKKKKFWETKEDDYGLYCKLTKRKDEFKDSTYGVVQVASNIDSVLQNTKSLNARKNDQQELAKETDSVTLKPQEKLLVVNQARSKSSMAEENTERLVNYFVDEIWNKPINKLGSPAKGINKRRSTRQVGQLYIRNIEKLLSDKYPPECNSSTNFFSAVSYEKKDIYKYGGMLLIEFGFNLYPNTNWPHENKPVECDYGDQAKVTGLGWNDQIAQAFTLVNPSGRSASDYEMLSLPHDEIRKMLLARGVPLYNCHEEHQWDYDDYHNDMGLHCSIDWHMVKGADGKYIPFRGNFVIETRRDRLDRFIVQQLNIKEDEWHLSLSEIYQRRLQDAEYAKTVKAFNQENFSNYSRKVNQLEQSRQQELDRMNAEAEAGEKAYYRRLEAERKADRDLSGPVVTYGSNVWNDDLDQIKNQTMKQINNNLSSQGSFAPRLKLHSESQGSIVNSPENSSDCVLVAGWIPDSKYHASGKPYCGWDELQERKERVSQNKSPCPPIPDGHCPARGYGQNHCQTVAKTDHRSGCGIGK